MNIAQQAVTAVLLGGLYALLASGLSLIFGVMRILNFAQGEFMMIGMYLAYGASTQFGMDPFVSAVPVAVVLFCFGVLVEVGLIERVPSHRHDAQLLLTLGLAIVLDNLMLWFFGSTPRTINTAYSSEAIEIAGLFINKARLYTALVAIVVVVGLFLLLRLSAVGRSMRAVADSPETAATSGINVRRVSALAFGIGSALAGLGGAMLSSFYPATPTVGLDFVLIMFLAVVLGGLGSVAGSAVAALVIALVLGVSELYLPLRLQDITVFAMFLLVLYLRPQGFVGVRIRGETVG